MQKYIEFENSTYKRLKKYDTYIKSICNDYIQLPQKEKKEMHNIKAWREENEEIKK